MPEEHLPDLVARIEEVTGDLDKERDAMIMILDVAFIRGTMKVR